MVHLIAGTGNGAGRLPVLIHAVEDLHAFVKREEIAYALLGVRTGRSGSIVENEFVGRLVIFGKIPPHIVVIISLIVQLEQSCDILMGDLIGVSHLRVEQICQRLRINVNLPAPGANYRVA